MTGARLRILVVGGQAEDVRAVDAGVRELGLSVDWIEPADAPAYLDAPDILGVVVDLDNTGLAVARVFRDPGPSRQIPLWFLTAVDTAEKLRTRAYGFAPSDCLAQPVALEVIRARAELELDFRRSPRIAEPGGLGADSPADHVPGAAVYRFVQGLQGGRRFTYLSAGIERMLGVTPAEVLENPSALYSLVVPEDLPRLVGAERESAQTLFRFDSQYRVRTRAGEVRWVRFRSAPRQIGDVLVWDGVMTDVTVDHQAALVLAESERRFRTMADAAPVLIGLTGADGKATWFNKPWLDFTGRALDRELGDGWTEGVHPDDRPKVVRDFRAAFDARKPMHAEYRLRRRDGAYRWVLAHAVPLAGPDGGFAGYIGTSLDITDRKEMEEALRAADRRREDYLAMLAHELRNPLAPIRTGLHILARRPDDTKLVSETRAMMGRQVENMGRIVDDLLDVSRVARGKVTLKPTRLDLADVARTCTEDRRAVARGGGVTLTFGAPAGPVWVDGDVTRLSQVLDNLIHNAVKFTPNGGTVAVTVTAEGDRAAARVRDTGTGIDPAMLPHLFEVFTQADRSLARSKGGLGLGLALVKGLTEMHGGTVEAHSEGPGTGSEFVVRLPRAREPAALTEVPVSPSSVGKKKRVLVIEDNKDSAQALQTLLDLSGYEVELAHTGPGGLEAAARFKPHAVVCDIGLPELDGYGVAEALRKRPEMANVRLIAVTGYGRTEDVEKARQAGFHQHLTKPVDPNELLEHLVSNK